MERECRALRRNLGAFRPAAQQAIWSNSPIRPSPESGRGAIANFGPFSKFGGRPRQHMDRADACSSAWASPAPDFARPRRRSEGPPSCLSPVLEAQRNLGRLPASPLGIRSAAAQPRRETDSVPDYALQMFDLSVFSTKLPIPVEPVGVPPRRGPALVGNGSISTEPCIDITSS